MPKKALIMVKRKPLIQHLIERVRTAKLPKLIVLCTTIRPEDSVFADIAKKSGIQCFRGSEKDILDRFLNAAIKYGVDFIVNVDGDDIFCDPELMDKTVDIFQKTNSDFIKWNELPLGASPLGIKVKALKKAWEIKDENDTETGWGKYFTDTGLFHVENVEPDDVELRHPEIRMTLDYPEDLKFANEVFNRLYQSGRVFTLKEILALLKKEPELTEINKGVQQEYWKRFNQRAKIKLRKRS